ncbi:hypothetical protein [Actinokineospora fastidiosa]|uniref:Uncharacterized protein n=1 Tax=Actinokineospora fastidiosa TaxID=1816 RepID=A0A918GMC6_9PSEU|nr:hypothetical protein [Actinokineospora fastidiosa]GGS46386.1 hypothetical protein GCM10010171_46990 [Actinokineospora fastidiosa]
MKRSLAGCLAVVLAASGSVAGAGPAQAVVGQECVGTWAVTYDPPITNTPQLVSATLTGVFPLCTDLVAFNGHYTQSFTDTVSCTTLLTAGAASRTYHWGNPAAAPSTFTYNWTVSVAGGQAVITNTGLITSGRFAPGSAVQLTTLATPDVVQCAGSGITTLTRPTTLTILPTT